MDEDSPAADSADQHAVVLRVCFPGSFNPFTVAHRAIADQILADHPNASLTFVISTSALGKDSRSQPEPSHRANAIKGRCADLGERVDVVVTTQQLLVDIASSFDLLVIGADKWIQINSPDWYPTDAARDDAIRSLPRIAVFARASIDIDHLRAYGHPKGLQIVSFIDESLAHVSATAVREGREEWRA
jgi:nicotinic acid mononucleotide adenylyltransferase